MAVKNTNEYNYLNGTYLHTKLQNIDIVEHLHLKLWSESSISEYFFNKWSISSTKNPGYSSGEQVVCNFSHLILSNEKMT
jgi:hypothetical protein